jgi:hypothetical protein
MLASSIGPTLLCESGNARNALPWGDARHPVYNNDDGVNGFANRAACITS